MATGERTLEIYRSAQHNTYCNLATEEYLMEAGGMDHKIILYLWQNEDAVVIGRNQNAYEQCNMDFIKRHNIQIARRMSGGGAVYHDLGNLNYSIIGNPKRFSKDENIKMVIDSIRMFGIHANASGRNDITVGGRKVSGTAYYTNSNAVCQHGCIMIHTDQDAMYRALQIRKDKYISKNINSVYARTVNLQELCKDIDAAKLSEQLVSVFCKKYCNHRSADIARIYEDAYYKQLVKKYSSDEWNIKENVSSKIDIYGRVRFGDCSIVFDVEEGVIKKTKIYTDALFVEPVLQVENILCNVLYDKDSIINVLEEHQMEIDICRDLIELIQEKMEN